MNSSVFFFFDAMAMKTQLLGGGFVLGWRVGGGLAFGGRVGGIFVFRLSGRLTAAAGSVAQNHLLAEFLEGNLAVAVFVRVANHFVDFFWFHAESDVTHGVRQLLLIDEAIVVEIEGREGQLNVVRRQHSLHVDGHELDEVTLVDSLVFAFAHHELTSKRGFVRVHAHFSQRVRQLLRPEYAVLFRVHFIENRLQHGSLFLRQQIRRILSEKRALTTLCLFLLTPILVFIVVVLSRGGGIFGVDYFRSR